MFFGIELENSCSIPEAFYGATLSCLWGGILPIHSTFFSECCDLFNHDFLPPLLTPGIHGLQFAWKSNQSHELWTMMHPIMVFPLRCEEKWIFDGKRSQMLPKTRIVMIDKGIDSSWYILPNSLNSYMFLQ